MSVKDWLGDVFEKLNPMNLITKALLSKYVGGVIRHVLTWVGGYLVMKNLATQSQADTAMGELIKLFTSPEFLAGLAASLTGLGASVKEKKERE